MAAVVVNTLAKVRELSAEQAAWGPAAWTVLATGTNSANVAVVAAIAGGGPGGLKPPVQHFLSHATISVSAAYTTVGNVQIKDGTTVIWQLEIALAAPLVIDIEFARPLAATPGNLLSVSQPAAGSAIVQTVCISGFSAPDQAAYT